MSKMEIETMVLGMVQTNCYIICNPETKEAIVIDPADNAGKIEKYLKENDLVCKGILLTHGHFDHIMAASELAAFTHAPICSHEEEKELLKDPNRNASSHIHRELSLEPEILLKDQENHIFAGLQFQVIHTPGHTQGGVCYYFADQRVLFSGDTLFFESIGRTDLPTGNYNKLIESIHQKLMKLEDVVEVYPGHGRPTTIGYERGNNPFLNDALLY